MRTKQCPGCKKHVKMDADKCKYCGYPFDLITKVKHEKIDEILEQFEKKYKERDKDSLLQYVGILQFLGYNQIDFLWSKINYIEGNCEEALKRLEYHSSKKKYTEEYIMHKFQCIALTGNIVAYLEYYNEVKKYFKNFWKVMTYYIECITNQTVEQDKKDYKSDGRTVYDFTVSSSYIQDNYYKSQFLKSVACALVKGIEQVTKIMTVASTTNVQVEVSEGNNLIVRNCKKILNIYDLLIADEPYSAFDVFDRFINCFTLMSSNIDEYNCSIQRSRMELKDLCKQIMIVENPNFKEPENILLYIQYQIQLGIDENTKNIIIKYQDIICDELVKKNPFAIIDMFEIDLHDLMDEKLSKLKSIRDKLYTGLGYKFAIKERQAPALLSRKGWVAFQIAERMFKDTTADNFSWHDAGPLSLNYFRILEVELNYRIINPILNKVDFNQLYKMYKTKSQEIKQSLGKDSKEYKAYIEKWDLCIRSLKNINNPNRNEDGMELGKLSRLINYISNPEKDEIASILYNITLENLTPLGQSALINGEIQQIISQDVVEKFRNPPAHTRYLQYSVACECRQYVIDSIHKIASWFKGH